MAFYTPAACYVALKLRASSAGSLKSSNLGARSAGSLNRSVGFPHPSYIPKAVKENVKDIGLDPIEDECKSWPMEFRRLRQEIIELWHECNVSLIHRTYFFMRFRGDPSDAMYLEVEVRRMKLLNDKFARGEKAFVNGQSLTLASSGKALRDERRMLAHRMSKKLSEHERETLFLKWGIGLNTKLRRRQLAHLLWARTDDMDHVSNSALLMAKLVGPTERGHAHRLNFTPSHSSRINSFRRSLMSFL